MVVAGVLSIVARISIKLWLDRTLASNLGINSTRYFNVGYILLWWSSCMSIFYIIKLVQQSRMHSTLLRERGKGKCDLKIQFCNGGKRFLIWRNFWCDMFFINNHITASSYLWNGLLWTAIDWLDEVCITIYCTVSLHTQIV